MIFVDTGAWIAVTDASDQYHYQAVKIYALLKRQRKRFVTTDYVIDETVTRLRYDAGHPSALRYLDLLHWRKKRELCALSIIPKPFFRKPLPFFAVMIP
jgi:predicted nucleic acid-binding protein